MKLSQTSKIIAVLIGIAAISSYTVSYAEDVKPSAKVFSCGTTTEECQKKVDELTLALQGATLQRDTVAKQFNDLQLQAYVAAQHETGKK